MQNYAPELRGFVLITQLRMKGPVHMNCGLVTDET